ncbi:hypothetical protein [Nonomuraea wenchangensis]|uniref:Uncharacterized protein n=1 Tax=Nonomuraea wenchangensis TaxID=568860 RepID=A0A1I0EUB1_9ACTN|nr:hypothetical protein [Nonomuraea wenchangensis]SET49018.1 hypothetical protein SAMN05421811_103204 [Nonomuraea wenchangensis]
MKVISFSLFGPDELYRVGAVENVRLCAELYPDFVCRFYVGDSIPSHVVGELAQQGAGIVRMVGASEDWWSTFWRFHALRDGNEVTLFRDADSRPCERERAAVKEWLASGRQFHAMRDHPEHGMPILAGMWGARRDGAAAAARLLPEKHAGVERWQADQLWLAHQVYPLARQSLMVHTSAESPQFEPDGFDDKRDFPTPRTPGRFVGQGFNGDGTLRIPADALRV